MLSVNISYNVSRDLLHVLYNNQDCSCTLPSLTLKLNYTAANGCDPWNHRKIPNFDVLLPVNGRKTKMWRVTLNKHYTMLCLMYSRKSVGPRKDPWVTPALSGYFCEDFPSRAICSCLLLRKDEIRANIWPDI